MSNKKIALFIGLNAIGHINPLIGVASKLKDEYDFRTIFLIPGPINLKSIEDRGHELLVIITDSQGKSFVTKDNEEKYTTHTQWNETMDAVGDLLGLEPEEAWTRLLQCKDGFGCVMQKNILAQNEPVAKVLEELKPSLIVLDTVYVYPCIIKQTDIPWVYISSINPLYHLLPKEGQVKIPGFFGLPLWTKDDREEIRQYEPEKWKEIQENWVRIRKFQEENIYEDEVFDKLYLDNGLIPCNLVRKFYYSPYLNLYLYPKEIDYDQEDDLFEYRARWFRCDTFSGKIEDRISPEEAELWNKKLDEAMKGKEAMIYFSLGTLASGVTRILQRFIDMFKSDKKRLYVISKGVNGDSLKLDSDNMIGENFLPQTLILKRANLAIIHGGNNTITECLFYGVPIIVLACFGDQLDNAQRIQDLELGKRLDLTKTTKEEMLEAIEQVIKDTSIQSRIGKISKNMQSRNDLSKVAMMLKKLADEKKLDEKFIDECRS